MHAEAAIPILPTTGRMPGTAGVGGSLATCLLLLAAPLTAQQIDDIAPFRLTSVDGTVSARYSLYDQERYSEDSPGSFETRDTWEEEVRVMTESYIYHPGFLNMDIGGGPLLVQQTFDSTPGSNDSTDVLLNYLARFNFLDIKNYPFSVYAQRSHPSITTSLSGRFLSEVDEYGFNGNLTEPWVGASLQLDLSRRNSNGSGFGAVVDEDVDFRSARFTQSYRRSDNIDLRYSESVQLSRSGSPGLPIQESQIETRNSELRTLNRFGRDSRVEVVQNLRRLQQDVLLTDLTQLDNIAYIGDLRWNHDDDTRSFFGYRLNDITRTEADSNSSDIIYRFSSQATDNLRYEVGADVSEVEQTGFQRRQPGIFGTLNYARETGFGSVGLGGSLRMERSDQEASVEEIVVIDEFVVLDGTVLVDLGNDFVIVDTVVVTNVSKTQTFIEGLDYRLVVVGSVTSIQRLVDGNIADGQAALISYRFRSGGTATYDSVIGTAVASLGFLGYFNAFVRYSQREFSLVDGAPTTPLNAYRTIEVGIDGDYPLWRSWRLGGQVRHIDQQEDISPQVRNTLDINVQGEVFGGFGIRLATTFSEVDIENSDEDVSLVNYRFGINTRFWRGTSIDYEASYLKDDGGSLPREQLQHRFSLRWAYRQMRFALRAQLIDDTLGISRQDYTQLTAELVRAF